MRATFRIYSIQDPRWNKVGRDFITDKGWPLNFDFDEYMRKRKLQLKCEVPKDLKMYVEKESTSG